MNDRLRRNKGSHICKLLADRDHCDWLVKQDWLQMEEQYRHLYNLLTRTQEKEGVVVRFPVERVRQ